MILNKLIVRRFGKSPQLGCSKIKDLLDNAVTGSDDPNQGESSWASSPYPRGSVVNKHLNRPRDQSRKSRRSGQDPRETSIIMFPGQGSGYVGMAKDLVRIPEARDMYKLASEVLGYDLLKLCNEGPQKKLDMTVYAQPAIAVTSLASLEKLKEERPTAINNCVAAAGFSLGEITALIFAGAIPFDQGVKLIQIRAEAMQLASNENPSGMAAVIYGPDSEVGKACVQAKEWCIERGIEDPECNIANYLYPNCKVIAGNLEALSFIEKNAKLYKLRKVKRLPVSGAFHTKLMEGAVEPFKKALSKIKVEQPAVSVHSNIDGRIYRSADHILRQLPKQIVKPVKWEQLLHILYERPQGHKFPRTFEAGPGQTLKAILKQVNAKAWDTAITADTIRRNARVPEQPQEKLEMESQQ